MTHALFAKRDLQAIKQGKIIFAAIAPLYDSAQIMPYQKMGFFVDPDWLIFRKHLYFVFQDPVTQQIDATTSYNSPTNPAYLLHRGPKDPLGLFPDAESTQSNYKNPGYLRDMHAVIDPREREKHQTSSCVLEGLDCNRIVRSVAYYRALTQQQIIQSTLPLYDNPKLSVEKLEADCQTASLDVFLRAYGGRRKLPLLDGFQPTRLVKDRLEKFFLV